MTGTGVDTNSAPSLLTKELSDLSLDEVLFTSLIFVAVLLAVLISFGIKTYLHQRKTARSTVEEEAVEVRLGTNLKPARTTPTHGAQSRDLPARPGSLRNSEPAMSKFDNGS